MFKGLVALARFGFCDFPLRKTRACGTIHTSSLQKQIARVCSCLFFVRPDQVTACQIQIRSKYGHMQRGN